MPKGVYERDKTNPIDRFNKFVEKGENNCWEWKGSKLHSGYGEFWNGSKKVLSHRWSYEYFVSKIPEGLFIDHLCRNRACCNPEHLEPVTNAENGRRGDTGHHVRERAKLITHCPIGHEYTEENTIIKSTKYKGKSRTCKACEKVRRKNWYDKKRLSNPQYFRDYNNNAYRKKKNKSEE